jgi:hypothetical protein
MVWDVDWIHLTEDRDVGKFFRIWLHGVYELTNWLCCVGGCWNRLDTFSLN